MYKAMFAAGIALYIAVIFIKKKNLRAVFSGIIDVLLAALIAAAGAGVAVAAAFLTGAFFLDAIILSGRADKKNAASVKEKITAGTAAFIAAALTVLYFSGVDFIPAEKGGFYGAGLLIFASCALLAAAGITLLFYHNEKEASGG